MSASCQSPTERARKMQSALLQRLAGTQSSIAVAIGVSESTVSRAKENFELMCSIAAHCGFKLVDESRVCLKQTEIQFLREVYARVSEQAPWLLNEAES